MEEIRWIMERLGNVSRVILTLLDGEGDILSTWPANKEIYNNRAANRSVIDVFRQRGRDARHPMILYIEPGFLQGVAALEPEYYAIIGLVNPYPQPRSELLKLIGEAISPDLRSSFCDFLLQQPLMSLDQLKDMLCLLTALCGEAVRAEDILLVDDAFSARRDGVALEEGMFAQREEAEPHVPVDFETAICSAIEAGNRAMLEKTLFAPQHGRIGCMSADGLRQLKYAFICLVTLVSRAAIRGGMPAETAFSLSDLYCQRMDVMAEIAPIRSLTVAMLMDYCDKVGRIRRQPATSPVVSACLSYISVHLHERITLELLSRHAGLCSRSLSMKFRAELGMGIPEYIHREKLREAEYLLLYTDYSLSEITAYLNYPSQSYFTHIFGKYKSITPQQFRDGQRQAAPREFL